MLLASLALGLLLESKIQARVGNAALRKSQALIAAEAGLPLQIREWSGMTTLSIGESAPKRYRLDQVVLDVEVYSENGKLDLNFCSPDDFSKLLRWAGAAPRTSKIWLSELKALRASGKQLTRLEELLDLDGASFEIFERIRPMVTVWTGRSMPDPRLASDSLRKALGLKWTSGGSINLRAALEIRTRAVLTAENVAVVSAVILLNADTAAGTSFRVLDWRVE